MKVTNNPTPNPYVGEAKTDATKNSEKPGKMTGFESVLNSSETASRPGANVEISENAQLMRQASDLAKSASSDRREKVESLKKSIQSGTYSVDAKEIADRLVEEHMNSDFGKNNL